MDPFLFGAWMRKYLERVEELNSQEMNRVVDLAVACVGEDRLIHTFGTGHSSGLAQETFYRAGGLANIDPITHPAYIPLLGAHASTVAERAPDLAQSLVRSHSLQRGDLGFVFSTSGRNPGPVEIATAMKDAGVHVVGVGSRRSAAAAPARSGGALVEIADAYWDTDVPVGDAAFDSGSTRVAPVSSLATVMLWNIFLAHLADRCHREGIDLPVWPSTNAPGGDATELRERFRGRIRAL